MGLKRTVEPTGTPISLAQAQGQCRVENGEDTDVIIGLMEAAVSMVEDYCGRALMEQTWRLTIDEFADRIVLPRGPVREVTGFTYLDEDGNEQTVSSALYKLDLDADPQAIVREPQQRWPTVGDYAVPISITYVSGHQDADSVPWAIRHAMLMLVANWYSNREALLTGSTVAEMPLGPMTLLQNHRSFAA